jgi:tetratricopeptide (TPR) repeat protein
MKIARGIVALLALAAVSCLAHADVVDLLKAGLAARKRGDLDAAIRFYSEAISAGGLSDTNLAQVLGSRGVTFDLKGETDRAIGDFNEAIRLKPDYGGAYIYRGLALVKKREYDRAITDFSEAITRDPSVAFLAFNDRANVYKITDEYDKAIGDYGRAIQRNPGYAAAYFNRASLSLTRGEYDEAITDFDRAIGLRPNYAEAYGNRAVAYQMKGEIDKAIVDFDSAVHLNPYDPVPVTNRGTVYAAIGEFGRAVADFRSAIVLKPSVAGFHVKRAQASLYLGHVDEAIAALKTALQLDPSNAFAAIWLHVAHLKAAADDTLEMKQVAASIDWNQWPAVILQLFLGGATPERVKAAAVTNADQKRRSERECQVAFYLGVFDLKKGDKTGAVDRFQVARDSCPSTLIEFAAAKAELISLQSK